MNVLYMCIAGLLMPLKDHVQGWGPHEPSCTSSFDYEHKVLHTIVKLEIEQESQAKQISAILRDAEAEAVKQRDEITKLQNAAESKNAEIKTLSKTIEDLSRNVTNDCSKQCKVDSTAAGYTYKDELAQATCMALGVGHMYAVRRKCSSSAPACSAVCSSLGKSCVNSVHVYGRPTLAKDDVGKASLHMYRYNNCQGGCGPNFCCCQG